MSRPASLGRLVIAAAVVGVLAAALAVAVRFVLDRGIDLLYGAGDVVDAMTAAPAWVRVVAPMLGGLAAGAIATWLARRGAQGVADVMEAVALGRGRPKLARAVGPALGSVAAALGGGSIGREGPLIQLGAGVGDSVAERVAGALRDRRALVAAGTAAGFAAAYNTPLAAMLFVLEVVLGVVTLDVLVPVAVATTIGTLLTRALVGGGPIYGVRAFELASSGELVAFALLGVGAALAGLGFMKLLGLGERLFRKLPAPRPVRAALGGLGVGLIALGIPAVAGNGYEPVRQILDGGVPVLLLLGLALAKALATTLSVTSGSPGGVFTPTMLLGACLGAAVGEGVAALGLPIGVGAVGGYALVGMAATVAATTHAPLMATVMAFELSGDYAIVLPLLLATAIATLLARRLQPASIYTAELDRRGVPWQAPLGERMARAVRARELMEPVAAVVGADATLRMALERLATTRARAVYVDGPGPLRAISLTQAKAMWMELMRGGRLPDAARAWDVALPIDTASPDDSLVVLGEKLWNVDWGELPIVEDGPQGPRLVGVVMRRALLGAFDRELLQRDALVTRVQMVDGARRVADYLELPDGHRLVIVPAPAWLVGAALDAEALRQRFGLTLVAVQQDPGGDRPPRSIDPEPGLVLGAADRLVVIGTDAEVARLASNADPG